MVRGALLLGTETEVDVSVVSARVASGIIRIEAFLTLISSARVSTTMDSNVSLRSGSARWLLVPAQDVMKLRVILIAHLGRLLTRADLRWESNTAAAGSVGPGSVSGSRLLGLTLRCSLEGSSPAGRPRDTSTVAALAASVRVLLLSLRRLEVGAARASSILVVAVH